MKRLVLTLMFVIAAIGGIIAGGKTKGQIKFEETTYTFGNIKEDGGKVSHEFVFTNTGKDPIQITSGRAECGCTTPEFPKGEIAPGGTGVIKVTYNPLGRPGGFTKAVTVRTTGTPGKVVLKIRGTVVPKQ